MCFGIIVKPVKDCMLPYNNLGFISKSSEYIATEKVLKIAVFGHPQSLNGPSPWNPREYYEL